jgi:hypothetical protein
LAARNWNSTCLRCPRSSCCGSFIFSSEDRRTRNFQFDINILSALRLASSSYIPADNSLEPVIGRQRALATPVQTWFQERLLLYSCQEFSTAAEERWTTLKLSTPPIKGERLPTDAFNSLIMRSLALVTLDRNEPSMSREDRMVL